MRGSVVLVAACMLALAGCRTTRPRAADTVSHPSGSVPASSAAPDGVLAEQRASMAVSDQERAAAALRGSDKPVKDRRDRPIRPPVRPPQ